MSDLLREVLWSRRWYESRSFTPANGRLYLVRLDLKSPSTKVCCCIIFFQFMLICMFFCFSHESYLFIIREISRTSNRTSSLGSILYETLNKVFNMAFRLSLDRNLARLLYSRNFLFLTFSNTPNERKIGRFRLFNRKLSSKRRIKIVLMPRMCLFRTD